MEEKDQSRRSLVDLIGGKHAAFKAGDYYALLGIRKDAATDEIRKAYFALVKQFHPDVLARRNLGGWQQKALVVFKGLSEAYKVLVDRKQRAVYDHASRSARNPLKPLKRPGTDRSAEARVFFNRGEQFQKQGNCADAFTCLRKAVELEPDSSQYYCALGLTVLQSELFPDDQRLEMARTCFDRAMRLSGSHYESHYCMSMYYKAVGDQEGQKTHLQDALTLNPTHVESKREIRLLTMRTPRNGAVYISSVMSRVQKLVKRGRNR